MTGFGEGAQSGVFKEPEKGAAGQNGRSDRTLEAKQDDDEDDCRRNEEENVHCCCLGDGRSLLNSGTANVHPEIFRLFSEFGKKYFPNSPWPERDVLGAQQIEEVSCRKASFLGKNDRPVN